MKTIRILGGKENTNALKVLTAHLNGLGHTVVRTLGEAHNVGFSWGCSYIGPLPWLNTQVNAFNKMEALLIFEKQDILGPKVYRDWRKLREEDFPVLSRKIHHYKGKDVKVCLSKISAAAPKNQQDFFTPWIPTETEYRVWVFQDKAFAIYEKVYQGEGEYKGYMRNMRFGFEFEKRDNLRDTKEIIYPSIAAVKALGMDFGAVDLLKGKDGKYYVLEVNSMPAIEHTQRCSGIRLAHRISKWAEAQ